MIYTHIFTFIPVVAIFVLMPYLVRRDNLFGISAPPAYYKEPEARKMRMTYAVWSGIIGVICIAAAFIATNMLGGDAGVYAGTGVLFVMLILTGGLYLIMHKKAKKIKARLKWEESGEPVAVADTSFYTKKIAVSKLWLLVYILIIAATAAVSIVLYPNLPADMPVHIGVQGDITYAPKSMTTVLMMPITQLIIAAIFAFVYYTLKKTRPELSADAVEATSEQNRKHRYAWSAFTVFGGMLLLLLFGSIQLEMLGIVRGISYIATIIFVAVFIGAVVVLSVVFGQSGSRGKVEGAEGSKTVVNRKDDKYWKMGAFYFNKNDPSVFVEKRFGIGYTLNFANPVAVIVMAAIVIIIIVSIIIGS
jgi:uncharacterized membrane protein